MIDRRERLVRRIETFAAGDGSNALVVFDNRIRPAHRETFSDFLSIEYAPPGQEADDVIRRLIRNAGDPANLTVVTSDRAIRLVAREHGAVVMASDVFANLLAEKPARTDSRPPTADKYNTELDDDEIRYWKSLFDPDGEDG